MNEYSIPIKYKKKFNWFTTIIIVVNKNDESIFYKNMILIKNTHIHIWNWF